MGYKAAAVVPQPFAWQASGTALHLGGVDAGEKRLFQWHLYDEVKPTVSIQTLLDEVDRDPTGIFWG